MGFIPPSVDGRAHLLPTPPTEPQRTAVNAEPHDTTDSLIFYLTRHLDAEQDRTVRHQLEAHVPDFDKHLWYYPWKPEEDGCMEDVKRIAYDTSVKGTPHRSDCILFIDRQSAVDGSVLIVECSMDPETDQLMAGALTTIGRMSAKHAPCAVVNSGIGNMDLIEFLNSDNEEWQTTLLYYHEPATPDSDDDSLLHVGSDTNSV